MSIIPNSLSTFVVRMRQIKFIYTTLWLLLSATMLSAAEISEKWSSEINVRQ